MKLISSNEHKNSLNEIVQMEKKVEMNLKYSLNEKKIVQMK